MNRKHEEPDILTFALAGLSQLAAGRNCLDSAVAGRLSRAQASAGTNTDSFLSTFKKSLQTPLEDDYPIVQMARQFSLTLVEILCLRLTMSAEEDLEVGHAIAQLQTPVAGHRPTVGLMAHAFGESMGVRAVQVLLEGLTDPEVTREHHVVLPTQLVIRETCASKRARGAQRTSPPVTNEMVADHAL